MCWKRRLNAPKPQPPTATLYVPAGSRPQVRALKPLVKPAALGQPESSLHRPMFGEPFPGCAGSGVPVLFVMNREVSPGRPEPATAEPAVSMYTNSGVARVNRYHTLPPFEQPQVMPAEPS